MIQDMFGPELAMFFMVVYGLAMFFIVAVLPLILMAMLPRIRYLLGIFYASMILLACILIAGKTLNFFWDTPSMLLVVSLSLGFIFMSGGGSLFWQGLRDAVLGSYESENGEDISRYFTQLFWAIQAIGFLGFLLGGIMMLSDLDPTKIGIGLAVSLFTVFYALFIGVVFILPIAAGYRRCPPGVDKKSATDSPSENLPANSSGGPSD